MKGLKYLCCAVALSAFAGTVFYGCISKRNEHMYQTDYAKEVAPAAISPQFVSRRFLDFIGKNPRGVEKHVEGEGIVYEYALFDEKDTEDIPAKDRLIPISLWFMDHDRDGRINDGDHLGFKALRFKPGSTIDRVALAAAFMDGTYLEIQYDYDKNRCTPFQQTATRKAMYAKLLDIVYHTFLLKMNGNKDSSLRNKIESMKDEFLGIIEKIEELEKNQKKKEQEKKKRLKDPINADGMIGEYA